ncbi:MAG: hypothetical protein QOG54_207 [Actinomycetota bacterium]|jgi:hypothetical protein|nr:hypothetical protein [Actinomycetota bacterium]
MFFRKTRKRVAQEVRTRAGEDRIVMIDDFANFFGLQSRGAAQMRGNGCLAITPDEVVFLMWLPRRDLYIPRQRITSVERVRSHLGKRIGRDLLKITFTDETGNPDSAAWFVHDLPAWEAALRP